ncbi:unnamed protein product, partial [Scytosiphon promiscuus]
LSKIFARWRQAHEAGARQRSWHEMRKRRALTNAVISWSTWLNKNRGLGRERAAREAHAEARRVSCALHHFREKCVRRRNRRHLRTALRIVRALAHHRPMARAWCHWQGIVLATQATVFNVWVATMRQQRSLKEAQRSVHARKSKEVIAWVIERWRRRAAASTLARLLHAWTVIGPARRAIGIMREILTQARVVEGRRHRLLRTGLRHGFIAFVGRLRSARSVALRGGNHHRTRVLRKAMNRWLVEHRLALVLAIWQRRRAGAKKRASIRVWASEVAVSKRIKGNALAACVRGLKANSVIQVFPSAISSSLSYCRRARLWSGLERWRSRTDSLRRQQRHEDVGFMTLRVRFLRRGLEGLNSWKQASRIACRTSLTRRTRRLSMAFSGWRRRAPIFRCQHNAGHYASIHFRRRYLTAGLSFWRRRMARVAGVRSVITRFQARWRLRLGLTRLCDRVKTRRTVRLSIWRAGVWVETRGARRVLKAWQRHARSHTGMEASRRIALGRQRARRGAGRHMSPLVGRVFCVMKKHAQARRLERRAMEVWLSYTVRATRASEQARKTRLRHGLLGLLAWVELFKSRRARCLKALKYRSHKDMQVAVNAWKNKIYPLGLRRQWGSGITPYACARQGNAATKVGEAPHHHAKDVSPRVRGIRCLQTTEAATAQDWKTSEGCNSLVLLRLPMVGQRLRQVLYVWRKRAQKEKQFRYIRETLPQKVRPRKRRSMRDRSSPTSYLSLHLSNASRKQALSIG